MLSRAAKAHAHACVVLKVGHVLIDVFFSDDGPGDVSQPVCGPVIRFCFRCHFERASVIVDTEFP